jgi:uncharacterized protein YozE (UPF0346 family)
MGGFSFSFGGNNNREWRQGNYLGQHARIGYGRGHGIPTTSNKAILEVTEEIREVINTAIDTVSEYGNKAYDAIAGIPDALSNAFSGAADYIENGMDYKTEMSGGFFDNIMDKFNDFMDNPSGFLSSFFNNEASPDLADASIQTPVVDNGAMQTFALNP